MALSDSLRFFEKNADMRECIQRMDRLREESDAKETKITE